MKKLNILFFTLINFTLLAQTTFETDTQLEYKILSEIRTFVSNNDKYKMIKKHAIYVINVYEFEEATENYSFCIGVILNEDDYKDVCATYYFELDSNILMIRFGKKIWPKFFTQLKLKSINEKIRDYIVNKLYPKRDGFIGGTPGIMLISKKDKKLISTNYESSSSIPIEYSIYCKIPIGETKKIR